MQAAYSASLYGCAATSR
jgi:phospholipase/carboxylesterase